MSFWSSYHNQPKEGVNLSSFTTLAIGGRARWFAEPAGVDELARMLGDAEREGLPVYVLGGGSNILINDGELNGLVVRLSHDDFQKIKIDEARAQMCLGAGVGLARAIQAAGRVGLAGLEYFAGIPGSIGGAVMVNAGGKGRDIGQNVEQVRAIEQGGRSIRLERSHLFFSYRRSNLDRLFITEIILQLRHDLKELISLRLQKSLAQKKATQPLAKRSAGCVFRNPGNNKSAGQLIDQAGCKGWCEGGAVVSREHANYFINEGGATYSDMLNLIDRVRHEVVRSSGVELELEIKLWL